MDVDNKNMKMVFGFLFLQKSDTDFLKIKNKLASFFSEFSVFLKFIHFFEI